mmetsp:Transcript_20190/g.68688  ORF Transcript_20190/g.68688 Transcript_20190/m.68688 type:complete len:271 (+) Transcript_20190:42-854(+)
MAPGGGEGEVGVERLPNGVVLVEIRRERARNALSTKLLRDLAGAFERLSRDESVRCAVLTGAGDKAFTAGIDLHAAEAVFRMGESEHGMDPPMQMAKCAFPIVCAVNGVAINAGFEIAMACDVVLCSEAAVFVDSHCALGLLPSWGLSQLLPRNVGLSKAMEASLGGRPVSAQEAERAGLASRVLPAAELRTAALELAGAMASYDPAVVRAVKRTVRDGLGGTLAQGRALERERAFAHYSKMPDEAFEAMRKRLAAIAARGKKGSPKAKL